MRVGQSDNGASSRAENTNISRFSERLCSLCSSHRSVVATNNCERQRTRCQILTVHGAAWNFVEIVLGQIYGIGRLLLCQRQSGAKRSSVELQVHVAATSC